MSYCKFCGSRLEEEALFCPGCGASRADAIDEPVRAAEPEVLPAPMAETPAQAVSPAPFRGMNGFAIAGFAAAFSVPLAGLILSIIALSRAKSGEYKNPMRPLATWGIIMSIVMMVLIVVIIVLYCVFMMHMFSNMLENIDFSAGYTY